MPVDRHDPLVSVLMTAYNRAAYIGEAIASVLASTFADFELIVVDDASNDSTVEVARHYEMRDARVKVHANPANLGDYANRNRAAALARGKYLKYLDSDDLLYPHGLGVMVACLERFPEAGYGLSQTAESYRPHPVLLGPAEAYRENFFGRDLFGRAPGSAILRTDAFRSVGGFSGMRQVGDHELWLRLGRNFPMATMPRDLVWDRTHGHQEQFYDSDADKLRMHWELDVAALSHPDCPLAEEERRLALARLDRRHAVAFWRYLLRQRSPQRAMRLRRAVGLAWPTVLIAPFSPSRASRPAQA